MSGSDTGAFGRAVEDWERRLGEALAGRDHAALRAVLGELHAEMDQEQDAVEHHGRAPRLDRLVEQARRVVQAAPTEQEALEHELSGERRIWAAFRERYRHAFLPAVLHPYVESSALLLSPSDDGVQFEGFDKYAAVGAGAAREAVTLMLRRDAGGQGRTPANFFCDFEPRRGRFTVRRAYRTDLPRGAGRACLAEHLGWLVPDPAALRELMWDNVQNSETYAALVDGEGDAQRVLADVSPDDCPLGRCGERLVEGLGLRVTGMRAVLDGFGFLDLILEVGPAA